MNILIRLAGALAACVAALAAAGPLPLPAPDVGAHEFTYDHGFLQPEALRLAGHDASGRFYVRGPFTAVNGEPRQGLARFLPDNSLDTAWMPALPAFHTTDVLAVDPLGRVVVGGVAGAAGGVAHRLHGSDGSVVHVLATGRVPQAITFDSASNAYLALPTNTFSPSETVVRRYPADSAEPEASFSVVLAGQADCPLLAPFTRVHAMLHDGARLYIAGDFTAIRAGTAVIGIGGAARVDAATGAIDTAWDPMASTPAGGAAPKLTCFPTPGKTVYSMALEPDRRFVYLGGFYDRQGVKYLARFSTTAPGAVDPTWKPAPDGAVRSVALDATRHKLYAAGAFATLSGTTRRQLGVVAALPGAAIVADWDPARISIASFTQFQSDFVAQRGDEVLVGGLFTEVSDGVPRRNAAAFPAPGPALIDDYYRVILGRAPEDEGIAYWYGEVARLAALGAAPREVYVAMATYFLGSPEFTGTARTNAEFLETLYRAFFHRDSDAGGLAYWTGLLDAGLPRDVVVLSFMFSAEFDAYTSAALGSGSAMRPETAVVVDFYRGAFERLPDSDGLRYWVNRFREAQCMPPSQTVAAAHRTAIEIARGFFTSAEYVASGATDADYVADLYNAFLRRGAEPSGFEYWVAQLAGGHQHREQVRRGFIESPEFNARVEAIATAGCIGPL